MYNRHYLPLRQVLLEWASQSGQSSDRILLTLAEHISQKALPLHTFQRKGGSFPNDIVIANLINGLTSSTGRDLLECRLAIEDWKISFIDLRHYCEVLQIRPPVCMTGRDGRLNWLHCTTLAPPQREPTSGEISALAAMRAGAMAEAIAAIKPRRAPPKSLSHAPGTAPEWAARGLKMKDSSKMVAQPLTCEPQGALANGAKPERKPMSKPAFKAWYREFVCTWTLARQPNDKDEQEAFEAAHPGRYVPRGSFRAARKEFGPASWRKRGRRPAAGNSADNSAAN